MLLKYKLFLFKVYGRGERFFIVFFVRILLDFDLVEVNRKRMEHAELQIQIACAAIGNQDAGDAVIAFLNLKLLEVTELDLAGHIGMETVGYAVIPAGNGGIVCFQLDMPGFPVGLRGVKAVYAVHRFAASGNGAALEFRTEQGVFHLYRLRLRCRHFQRGERYFFERGIQLGQKRL